VAIKEVEWATIVFFRIISNCGKGVERQKCKEMRDCHARRIQLSWYQQHLVVGAIPQG
jgi:hypothetical protein